MFLEPLFTNSNQSDNFATGGAGAVTPPVGELGTRNNGSPEPGARSLTSVQELETDPSGSKVCLEAREEEQ